MYATSIVLGGGRVVESSSSQGCHAHPPSQLQIEKPYPRLSSELEGPGSTSTRPRFYFERRHKRSETKRDGHA